MLRAPSALLKLGAGVIFLVILAVGCAGLDPYRIGEHSIGKYLTGYVGPAERYHVHIERDGTDLSGGYLSHVSVSSDELETHGGMRIHRLDADLHGVRFNRREHRIISIDHSSFIASITTAAANAYLTAHDRGIPGLRVEFEPETIVVKAEPLLLGLSIPVTLRGRGEADSGHRIRFLTDAFAVSRMNIPISAVHFVEQRLDPVFDVDELKLPVRVTGVESRAGEIVLYGEVKLI